MKAQWRTRLLALAAVLNLTCLDAIPPGLATESPAVERMTGTVCAVDLGARTLDLMTGVGHALRVRRVLLPPRLEIRAAADSVAPALTRGCVIRVECGRAAGAMVASTVTVLRLPSHGVKP